MLARRLTSATETLAQLWNLPSHLDNHQGMSRDKDAEVENEKQGTRQKIRETHALTFFNVHSQEKLSN